MALSTIGTNQISNEIFQANRNLVINGAMQVAQRGTSFSFAHDGTRSAYTVDRFSFSMRSTSDEYDCTVAQVSDGAAGFSNSLKLTTGTAESAVGSDEYYTIYHPIEAQNLQSLQYGTSGAQTITISFYVKSSLTGTFGFSIYAPDNTERVIAKTYTINSANTWEKKTITMAGDTSIAINDDNGGGMYLYWLMAAGTLFNSGASTTEWADYGSGTTWFQASATNAIVTTAGATWQLTGVQLEVGEAATPFEVEDIGTTLRKCQRYYVRMNADAAYSMWGAGFAYTSTATKINIPFPVEMRTAPSLGQSANNTLDIFTGGASPAFTSDAVINNPSSWGTNLTCTVGSITVGYGCVIMANNSTAAYLEFIAEL